MLKSASHMSELHFAGHIMHGQDDSTSIGSRLHACRLSPDATAPNEDVLQMGDSAILQEETILV